MALLLVRGQAVFGEAPLLEAAGTKAAAFSLDGARRALAEPLARRLASVLRRHPAARETPWLSGVAL